MAVAVIHREVLPTKRRRPRLRCADPARRRIAGLHPTTPADRRVTYQAGDWRSQDGRIRASSVPHPGFRRVLPAYAFPRKGRKLKSYQTMLPSIVTDEQSKG